MPALLDSLRVSPPSLSVEDLLQISKAYFGIEGTVKLLGGERDLNVLVQAGDQDVLIKVANSSEDNAVLDMQCKALQHIQSIGCTVQTPRLIQTLTSKNWATLTQPNGSEQRVRAFTFLQGTPISESCEDAGLLNHLGQSVATLNHSLRGFFHSAANHALGWNIQYLDQLSPYSTFIQNDIELSLVNRALSHFNQEIKPQLNHCRSQIIHNDISFHNTLSNSLDPSKVTGIYDFGDMVFAPLIQDLANTAAEVPAGCLDPFSKSADIIAGFHSVTPLEEQELELLPGLISSRLCLSLIISAWSEAENAWTDEREHLKNWKTNTIRFLEALQSNKTSDFLNLIRSTCGLSTTSCQVQFPQDSYSTLWNKRKQLLGNAEYYAYQKPIHMVRGKGVWLYDSQNTAYLDAYNNVPHAGHCHPRIVNAISQQSATLNTNTRYLYDSVTEYADKLIETLPSELDTCYFVSSGSEANDLAWRLSKSWTESEGVIALDDAYHGITDASFMISPTEFSSTISRPTYLETITAPNDYRGRWERHNPHRGKLYGDLITVAIDNLHSRGLNPAAFFLDMIMSSSGIFTPPPQYLEAIFKHVRDAGGLCIADEVQSGFGRTGEHMWGFQFGKVIPDIITLGKPIAGGYPMGLVVTRKEIAIKFESSSAFFSTTGGNPVACTAALAMLNVIKNENLIENAKQIGQYLINHLHTLSNNYPLIGDVRGSGLFIGVELVKDRETKEPALKETLDILDYLSQNAILIGSDSGNVLKIRPPMVFEQVHADLLLMKLEEALQAVTY